MRREARHSVNTITASANFASAIAVRTAVPSPAPGRRSRSRTDGCGFPRSIPNSSGEAYAMAGELGDLRDQGRLGGVVVDDHKLQRPPGRLPAPAKGQADWLPAEPVFFFLLLPLMNWISICEPFTRTSSQRR